MPVRSGARAPPPHRRIAERTLRDIGAHDAGSVRGVVAPANCTALTVGLTVRSYPERLQ